MPLGRAGRSGRGLAAGCLALVLASGLLPGCGGARLVGGRAVAAGDEPPGRLVAVYDPRPCVDAAGASFDWRTRFFVVEQESTGEWVVVAARTDYATLVYDRSVPTGATRSYELLVRARGYPPMRHVLRLPSASEPGSFTVTPGAAAGQEPAVSCALTPLPLPETVDNRPNASKLTPP